ASLVRERVLLRTRTADRARRAGRAGARLDRRPGGARRAGRRPRLRRESARRGEARTHRARATVPLAAATEDPEGAQHVTIDTAPAIAALAGLTKKKPTVAIVLGSGLGALADEVQAAERIPYERIPGWKRSTVAGHAGELVVGSLEGKTVAVMNGRLHYYEGYDMLEITFPVRVFKAWGIDTIILTNACGGLNPSFKAGDLMVISDHINFMAGNPLRGPNEDTLGPRFPDMVGAYTEQLRTLAHAVDKDLREGVYVAVAGPNFETPAELRMLRRWGADAVGMSTVPEVLAARHLGMRILAIATVTDMATGIPGQIEHVTGEQVLEVAARAGERLGALVKGVVAKL